MYNNRQLIIGFVVGMLVPAFLILMMYAFKFSESSFTSFVSASIRQGIAPAIIALSQLGNLGLFFLFLKFDRLWASRGVILATFLYICVMLYFKMGA
ncbi:MAG: hypothetical protein GC180_07020 [Bacteroidetes bacterium]|nr:hypothetical protein [Bacteroidota bacterium]